MKILMIEDDLELAEILSEYLEQFNIKVINYGDPYLGISALNAKEFDLLILDLTLPSIDGLDICKKIRESSHIPIIISSARSDVSDKIIGLEMGADDYLPKPYDPKELYARIKSLIRRQNYNTKKESNSDLILNENEREIYLKNNSLNLTQAEYEILAYFIKKEGNSISREEILNSVNAISYDSSFKSIDVIVGRIRTKLNDSSKNPKYIQSVRGIGYRLMK